MKFLQNTLAAITTLAIIILSAWLVYWGIQYIIGQFQIVDPSIAATLTISAVILIISSIIISGAIRSVTKSGDKAIHPEKAIIYKKFLDIWYSESKYKEYPNEKYDLDKAMSLWASDFVLKQYINFKNTSGTSPLEHTLKKVKAEKVVLAMRRDLGQNNFGVKAGSINDMLGKTKSTEDEKINS